jgi:hypothetical protein
MYADRTEHIIPCTRKIAPNDENTNHHKRAEKLHHISHSGPFGSHKTLRRFAALFDMTFRSGSMTHISANQIKKSPVHDTFNKLRQRCRRIRTLLSQLHSAQLTQPYVARFASIPSQEGQTKMSCSKRAPSFGIVRRCFMVSPQEGHTRIGVLSGTSGGHSMAGIEGT